MRKTITSIIGILMIMGGFLAAGSSYALGPNPPHSAGATETSSGSCSGCSGWVWVKPKECWRYVSGSEERIWMYTRTAANPYMYVDTGDARAQQFIAACGAGTHWIAGFWTSSSIFSNVRLWYN